MICLNLLKYYKDKIKLYYLLSDFYHSLDLQFQTTPLATLSVWVTLQESTTVEKIQFLTHKNYPVFLLGLQEQILTNKHDFAVI